MSLSRVPLRAPEADAVASEQGTRVFTKILGAASSPELHDALHRLEHAHAVDHVRLPRNDLARRRLRTNTEMGREIAIALPRDQQLFDGAVLECDETAALVVRVETEQWLSLTARDHAAALALGYFCGNLHWRVRFEGERVLVAVEVEERFYHDRLAPMIAAGEVRIVGALEGVEE